jgi:DNA invertase Pin-like site-specific DNA recombinase
MAAKKIPAFAYMRTSSATNVGPDKDSDKRQRAAIAGFAKGNGYAIVDEYYDEAVSGSDPIGERSGFKALLQRIAANGVRTIIIESPDRFARDLAVQLAGHDYLKTLGVELIPASAPDFFTEDTPTAVLVRQVLGAISEFERTSLIAKLKAARDRKRATGAKVEGRMKHAELRPEAVTLARQMHREGSSLREISAELAADGHLSSKGRPFSAQSVKNMLNG